MLGAVDTELVGEGFLGEAFGEAVGPKVAVWSGGFRGRLGGLSGQVVFVL